MRWPPASRKRWTPDQVGGDGQPVVGDGYQVGGDGQPVGGDGYQVGGDGGLVKGDGQPVVGDGSQGRMLLF